MKKLVFVLLMLLSSCRMSSPEASVIKLTNDVGNSGGTGFEVVAPSGKIYTLTNRHICMSNDVYAEVGDRHIPLHIIEISADTDLCLLEPLVETPALKVSNIYPVNGDHIDVYGYGMLMPLTHTSGEWVGKTPVFLAFIFNLRNVPEYTTVSILPGNSGSPVLDESGDVVGVVFATGEAINFRALIISLDDVKNFLKPY